MLLSEKNMIKLADIGMSKLMEENNKCTHFRTQQYMSPELFKPNSTYYSNVDVWYEKFVFMNEHKVNNYTLLIGYSNIRSLGCVLYELIFLRTAFSCDQRGDAPIPSDLSSTGIFSSILPRYLTLLVLSFIIMRI